MELNPYASPREISDEPLVPVLDVSHKCCHLCGGESFKRSFWWHPLLLHWILNPGLALNELLIGTRIPATTFNCVKCAGWSGSKGSFVECPHCQGFHRSEIWQRNFGHWLGLVCPDCGKSIPCLINLTSVAILLVTFPLWWPISLLVSPHYKRWAQQRAVSARGKLLTLEANVTT